MAKINNVFLSPLTYIHPAQLWVGNHITLIDEVTTYLQKHFCPFSSCNACAICIQITQQQHHAITWIAPEKMYTLELLEPIFTKIGYTLEHNELHFFILQKADLLSTLCANKLLKSIEEPPTGYHFILLTDQKENILETIRSRCIITQHSIETNTIVYKKLFNCFTILENNEPLLFTQILDQSNISEYETTDLLDLLLAFWSKKRKLDKQQKNAAFITNITELITRSYAVLPMPGGAKLFWRNFYLQFQNIITK